MRIASAILAYGTSEGLEKAWDTRGRGRAARPTIKNLNRSALSKKFSVPVNPEKIHLAAESVQKLAAVIGGTVTTDSHPYDILKGKIGIEVKRFLPGHKHLKITVHPDSKEKKIAFAKKNGLKKIYVVVHDATQPGNDKWYAKRAGDKGQPWADPKEKRPGWSFNTRTMIPGGSDPSGLKGVIK